MTQQKFQPAVSVDFDQTIFPYTRGWTGVEPDDEPPFPGAKEFLRALKVKGYKVIIFSVRVSNEGGKEAIKAYLKKYGLMKFVDMITDVKQHSVAYVDDRAVHFSGDYLSCLRQVEALAKREKKEPAKI